MYHVLGDATLEECLHWIPGWIRSEDDPENLFEMLCQDRDASMQARLNVVKDNSEIERLMNMHLNLTELQLSLWRDWNIAGKGTIGDGNCGVEMLMSFDENIPTTAILGQEASRSDVLDILGQYRLEISGMWAENSKNPDWQRIWKYFVKGRVDMKKWIQISRPAPPMPAPSTPPPQHKDKSVLKTPEKDVEKGKLIPGGEEQIESVSTLGIVLADGEDGPPLKKKRTGKARSLEDRINFKTYAPRRLAELGLTYKQWTREHQQDFNLVWHGC